MYPDLEDYLRSTRRTATPWIASAPKPWRNTKTLCAVYCSSVLTFAMWWVLTWDVALLLLTATQARRYSTATQWANILSEEFANQGMMEQELRMETCLFGGPPELGNIIKLGTSQIGFMDFFAIPLFRTMSLLLPGMTFTIDEIHANKAIWERTIETEKQRASKSTSSTDDRAPSQSQRMTGLELTQSGRSSFITSSPSSRETSGGHRSHFAGVPDPRKTSLGPPVVSSLPSANTSMSTSQTSNVLAQPLSPPAMVTSPIQVDGVRVVQGGQDEGCGASPNVDRKKERKFSFKFWRKSSV